MGYQLPGFGNVTFPGFGALGKQQTKDTKHSKKGKDQAHPVTSTSQSSSSSSVSSSLASAASRPSYEEGRLLDRGFLQKWRVELRPLLKSLRFIEESNKESCSSVASCIGPFQISRHYHHDAWRHSPAIAWSRCRDLNYAENTVIAYWFKYCPEAVEKHDFETLVKIHKGGPEGLQKEETNYFWIKVSQHLKEQEAIASKKENTAWVFFSNENHGKQVGSSKIRQKSSPVLSSINNNTMASSKAELNYVKSPASSVTPPKQQVPLMQTLKPKMFRRAAAPAKEKKSAASLFVGAVKHDSGRSFEDLDCRSTNKRLRQLSFFHSNNGFEQGSLGHAFNMEISHLSRGADWMEEAAISVQAIWRMRCVRRKYVRMRSAAMLIQRKWRKHRVLLLCKQRICLRAAQDHNSATSLCLDTGSTHIEKQTDCARPIGSPCELLYRADISPNQEDELLSELVSLLKLDTQSPIDACPSFRFPCSLEETSEACTPKMTLEMRQHFAESPNLLAKSKAQEPDCIALPYSENTPLVIKQALLSPIMEKEIISELAKLFPPYKEKPFEDVSIASLSIVSPENGYAESSRSMETQSNVVQELCGKDSIMRRLTFNSAGSKEYCRSAEIAAPTDVGFSEEHAKPCKAQCSLMRTSEDICSGTSSSFNSKADGDEEALKHIGIPLLVAQSPVLTSRKRVRSRNPCNRKIEKALVSSLSEWQYSVSFDKESGDREALREEGLKADLSVDAPSSFTYKEFSTSEEFILCSLTKSVGVTGTNSLPKSRLMDIATHPDYPTPTKVSDDCLLETSYEESSTVYAKAIFRCLNFSLDVSEDGELFSEESQIRSRKMGSGRISTLSTSRLASLQSLCMLWDTHNVDLLTRSLKFKALQAVKRKNQQEHTAADDVADIEIERANLENLPEERKKKELVLHQRDVIYTNIAAYCNAQERQDLYDKWEIQKLLTGRLKKIVYELLWVEPQRYGESAELVIQYL